MKQLKKTLSFLKTCASLSVFTPLDEYQLMKLSENVYNTKNINYFHTYVFEKYIKCFSVAIWTVTFRLGLHLSNICSDSARYNLEHIQKLLFLGTFLCMFFLEEFEFCGVGNSGTLALGLNKCLLKIVWKAYNFTDKINTIFFNVQFFVRTDECFNDEKRRQPEN